MTVSFGKFSDNLALSKLLSLVDNVYKDIDDSPDISNNLIGDWDKAEWGQMIHITWADPYKCETGYLFTLPGLEGGFISRTLVHIPHTEEDPSRGRFFTLSHLACVVSTIELEELKW